MWIEAKDIEKGDYIRVPGYYNKTWHKVLDIGNDWSGNENRVYIAIEGYGSERYDKNLKIEKKE